MKKGVVILVLACIANLSYSQIHAVTEDGKKVLLKTDSTWVFVKEETNTSGNENGWTTGFYVDNYGDKTNQQFKLFFDQNGIFSNSASAGAVLFVKTIIDDNNIRFDLFEYGRGQSVGKEIGGAVYVLKVKSNELEYEYKLDAFKNTLALRKSDKEKFMNMLKSANSTLKCYLKITGQYSFSTYNFTLEPLK